MARSLSRAVLLEFKPDPDFLLILTENETKQWHLDQHFMAKKYGLVWNEKELKYQEP